VTKGLFDRPGFFVSFSFGENRGMKIDVPNSLSPLARAFSDTGVPAYAVGGLVRNALLGLPPSDIDVCSRMTPDELMRELPARGMRVVPKAAEMGTVELHFEGVRVEHTTFRREAYDAGGAHRPREVAFGTSLECDARRRDFSVNALYADLLSGEVIDPTGGTADLKSRVLRTTSDDPDEILRSDALRVLRLVRFACELGFAVDKETWRAAKRNAAQLTDIAPERRRDELIRILLCDARYRLLGRDELRSPLRALRLLDEMNVWDSLVPEFLEARGMVQRPDHHRYDVLEHSFRVCALMPPDETLRLAGLLHDVGKPACRRETGKMYAHDEYGEAIAERVLTGLRFPKRMVKDVCALVRDHMYDVQNQAKEDTLRLRFAAWGRERTMCQILLREADIRGCGYNTGYVALRWRALFACMLRDGTPFSERELAVTGDELKEVSGLPEGEALGALKRELYLHCVRHPQDNRRERLLHLAGNRKR